ncbi:MAG: hypothetical protein B1H02_03060 [Candidatus Latescibacteria bacterium 4484_107]|nr:MAG: hypothetical protein B1H02_03060 [Candidatus Latescibacteria bacterium 4484_107]
MIQNSGTPIVEINAVPPVRFSRRPVSVPVGVSAHVIRPGGEHDRLRGRALRVEGAIDNDALVIVKLHDQTRGKRQCGIRPNVDRGNRIGKIIRKCLPGHLLSGGHGGSVVANSIVAVRLERVPLDILRHGAPGRKSMALQVERRTGHWACEMVLLIKLGAPLSYTRTASPPT